MKEIPGFENYCATKCGRIYSKLSKRFMSPSVSGSGYYSLSLRKNGKCYGRFVHRLVAMAYFGESDMVVNHKDSDRLNNKIDNLEYCTYLENNIHGLVHGKRKLKYTKECVNEIRRLISMQWPLKEISKWIGVPYHLVKDINQNRSRRYV